MQKKKISRQPWLFILLSLLVFTPAIVGQDAVQDSVVLVQQLITLQQQEKYASAHLLVENYLQQNGLKPYFVCWMVKNGLHNYYHHENYQIFFLKDKEEPVKTGSQQSQKNISISRLLHPHRILENTLQQYPKQSCVYALLGFYYDIQLKALNNFDFARLGATKELEEKIYLYYTQAEKLGYKDIYLNRWLGDYYSGKNQVAMAEKYYQYNAKKIPPDPISLFRLSEINYQKKQYTQTFNYANEALKYLPAEDMYLRYDAVRLAASSLRELGEVDRFIQLTSQCIEMIPDLQYAYIDLIEYYGTQQKIQTAETLLTEMLLKNPYELDGYRVLEKHLRSTKNFTFADTLFTSMLVKYENWDEVLANIYWSRGNLAYYQDAKTEAMNFWEISRNYMRRYLPANHPLMKQVGAIAQ